jgi:hypothetical protein
VVSVTTLAACALEAGHGIDRKNSSLGYVMGNCSACCATCNHIRGKDFISRSEMIEVAKLLCALRIPLTFIAVAAQGNPERNSCISLYIRHVRSPLTNSQVATVTGRTRRAVWIETSAA